MIFSQNYIAMGKGDIKSKRGKIYNGTFGVRRPKKKKSVGMMITDSAKPTVKPQPTKAAAKKSSKK